MDGWLPVVEVAVAVVLLLGVALLLLALRRRWLARQGGTFECGVRLRTSTPGAGWALGVARYNLENFEWFRFFSYALRPRVNLLRANTQVVGRRRPEPAEAVALYAGQEVVLVEEVVPGGTRDWELAMNPDSLTGLLAWLEAAPPGVHRPVTPPEVAS